MTFALTMPRYKSYQEYLNDLLLSPDVNYRLRSTGELIEVASEDDLSFIIAHALDFRHSGVLDYQSTSREGNSADARE